MLDNVFIILFFSMPLLIIRLMHKMDLRLFTISIPSFLIISIFIFAYLGLFPLYFGWEETRIAQGIVDKEVVFQVYLFSLLTIFGLLGGYAFSKYILKLDSISFSLRIQPLCKKEYAFLIGIMFFCFFVLLLYLSKVKDIALLSLITENMKEATIARSLMTNDFPGKYHWYSLAMHHLLSIVTFIFFSAYLVSKKYSVLILFIISFIVSSFIAVMTIEKAPFIWLIIGLFLTYYLSKHKGKIPITSTILLAGSVLVLLVMFYMVWSNNSNVILSLKAVFSRATIGSIQPAYYYLEFFPDQQEFLFGKSFPNPGGLLPFKPYSLTVEIMNWKFPEYIKWGVVGSMPTIFWAEAYANFNYYGVIIIPFFVGIAIWIISYLSNKIENTPIKIGLLVWLILHYKDLSITGFSGYLIDFYFIFVTVTFGIIILITNIFKIERTI